MQSWRMVDATSRVGSFGRLRWQFAFGQHVCMWAARLLVGSTFAFGQHVCFRAASLRLGSMIIVGDSEDTQSKLEREIAGMWCVPTGRGLKCREFS